MIEQAVYAFLDCGIYDRGFARVVCNDCRAEFLVAFSCQRRGVCPSCAAKRGATFGVLLAEEVLEDVGHALWTFTIPKMLRPYFLHHRELLGELCRAGWEVVRELMVAAPPPRLLHGDDDAAHTCATIWAGDQIPYLCDDVLQVLVALQDLLHPAGHPAVILAQELGRHDAARRDQWIAMRLNRKRRDREPCGTPFTQGPATA